MPVLSPEHVDEIEAERSSLSVAEIARYLQEQLGQKMAAYVAGVNDARMVGRWAAGKHRPQPDVDMRLRHAYQTVRLLVDAYSAETAKAWLFGSNSRLDDEAPAYVLRHAESWEDLRPVVPVARGFAGAAH